MSHTFATKRLKKRSSPLPEEVIVRVNKYDGSEYRRWKARIVRRDGSLIVIEGEFEDDVQHELLGEIRRGTRTVEFYWLDCWYNVFQFLKSDRGTRLYYCNISTPPILEGGVLSYTDLDIDVLVQPDLSYDVLDLEEFEQNARLLNYSDETKRRAHEAVIELVLMIKTHQFPFVATSA